MSEPQSETPSNNPSESREYSSWESMKARCYNTNNNRFKHYGGKGITVCPEWRNDFQRFLADMGPRPPGTSIERKDGSLSYCKDNCRWATPTEQARNISINRVLTLRGESLCVTAWAERMGVPPTRIFNRLLDGWSEEDAVFAPKASPRRGAAHPCAKLAPEIVERLKQLKKETRLSYRKLGALFGVSDHTAMEAINGESWKS